MELTLNRVAAGLVGVAMVAGLGFAFAAERAHAELSLSDIVELFIVSGVIPADKAEEARALIEGQEVTPATPTTPSLATTMSCSFTRNLSQGATGQDVMDLQKLLNAKGFAVAATGAGSPGQESSYYGPATAAAVARMQTAFASEILAPLGLTQGTGFFGLSTRTKANALCAVETPTTPTVPTVPGDEDEEDMDEEEDEDSEELSGGEASFESFSVKSSPKGEELQAGDEEVAVAAWEFDVEDADAELRRVDLMFELTATSSTNTSDEPWDYFDAVQLWVNGEMVAEEEADDESNWDDLAEVGNVAGDSYRMRFSGVNEFLAEGETAEIAVSVTAAGNLDSDDEEAEWTVWVPEDGIRAIDGEGLDVTIGDDETSASTVAASFAEERSFAFEVPGEGEEVKVSISSSNPDSSVIKVDEDDETDDVAVLVFDIEAEESDMEVQEIVMNITIAGGEAYDDVVSDIALEIDGEVYDDIATYTSTADTDITFEIDGDLVIDADSEVEAKLLVSFLRQDDTDTFDNGTLITGSFVSIDADGEEDGVDFTGTANGEAHSLQSMGIYAEIVSTDVDTKSNGTADDTVGEFVIKFDVTAFEDTYYISATNTAETFGVSILKNGTATSTPTASIAVSSTASKVGTGNSAYRIDEGEQETFTLTITYEPNAVGNYAATLSTIDFGDSETATLNQNAHTAAPSEDFETDPVYINA